MSSSNNDDNMTPREQAYSEICKCIIEVENLEWNHKCDRLVHPRADELTFLRRTLAEPYLDPTDDRYNPGYDEAKRTLQNSHDDLQKKIQDWTSMQLVEEVCKEGKVMDRFWTAMATFYTESLGVGGVWTIKRHVENEFRMDLDAKYTSGSEEEYVNRVNQQYSTIMKRAIQMAKVAKEIADELEVER